MISKLLIVALVACMVHAATWFDPNPPKPPTELAHKKGCYIQEINDVVPYGTVVTPVGHCYRISCSGDGLDYASCGVIGVYDPDHTRKCYVTETDLTKPYPKCCPHVECDDKSVDENKID